MAELKQGRWVKVHEPGQANFVEHENVMDIVIGTGRLQAEATYTVRSYKKAAYWLGEYLKAAEALQIVADEMLAKIQDAAASTNREEDEMVADGAGWNCTIERMGRRQLQGPVELGGQRAGYEKDQRKTRAEEARAKEKGG